MAKASIKIKAPSRTRRSKDTHINFGIMIFSCEDEHWDSECQTWLMSRGLLRTHGLKALKKLGYIDSLSSLSVKNSLKIHKSLTNEIIRYHQVEGKLKSKDDDLRELVYGWLHSLITGTDEKIPTRGGILLGAIYNNKDIKNGISTEYVIENLPPEIDIRTTKMLQAFSDLCLRIQYK